MMRSWRPAPLLEVGELRLDPSRRVPIIPPGLQHRDPHPGESTLIHLEETAPTGRHVRDVVLLHGCPSPAADFALLARRLASAGCRVLTADLPGYGRSPRLEPYSLPALYASLEAALLEKSVRSLALVGFSRGAYLSFGLALRARLPISGIVSLAGLAAFDDALRQTLRGLAAQVRPMRTITDPSVRGLMPPLMLSAGFAERHPEARERVTGWLELCPPAVLADEMESSAGSEDLLPRLQTLRCPVLLRVGALDAGTPHEQSRRIAERIPGAALQIVPGVGHALFLEDEAATLSAVEDFVRGLPV